MELRNWKGEDLKRLVKLDAGQRIEAACILLKNEIKHELVAKDNPRGNKPSAPGETPAKVTGRLSQSISHEVDKSAMTGRVGTNVLYAKFLELGTRYMAARPFLQKVFNEHFDTIKRILKGK